MEMLCDYILVANGERFKVHRVVMASCSDYFRVMLTGDMKESRENFVELMGITAAGLKIVIDFVYDGNLDLTADNVQDVLSAATHLQISNAITLCCQYIEAAITFDNCIDVLNLAELYSLTETYAKAKDFILHNFETVSEGEQFFKLDHTQLLSMLAHNSLRVVSEYHLFELVLRWIKYNTAEREQYISELMRNIRLQLLTGEELVDKVSPVEVMKREPTCCELLTEAKDYHIVVSKQPLLQNNRTQVRSDRKSLVMCHASNVENFTFDKNRHGYLRDSTIPLYNPCVCVVDNFMYVCGGKYDCNENNEIATARCFRYDPRFDTWFELTSMNEARKDFALVANNGCLYAIAGQDENLTMCTMECFHIDGNDWELKASMFSCLYSHVAAECNDKIYVAGGQRFTGCCNNVTCYDVSTDNWEVKASLLKARCNHVMQQISNFIYVLGGNVEDGYGFPVPIVFIERYNPGTDQWTFCQQNINIREAGACVMDNKIYVVGGINGDHYYSDIIDCYDPLKDEVTVVERFSTRIHGLTCCILTLPQYVCNS